MKVVNDLTGIDLGALNWQTRSFPDQSCVEWAPVGDGRTAFRNSDDPKGPVVCYKANELTTFYEAIRTGTLTLSDLTG